MKEENSKTNVFSDLIGEGSEPGWCCHKAAKRQEPLCVFRHVVPSNTPKANIRASLRHLVAVISFFFFFFCNRTMALMYSSAERIPF